MTQVPPQIASDIIGSEYVKETKHLAVLND